ncbi:MAG: serine--tRNA ligase [Clostridiales bacterium]|nr:serine--tRNA ligase [Clostridiales bacterium]
MLDKKMIVNDRERIEKLLKKRNEKYCEVLDRFIEIDKVRRRNISWYEELKADLNKNSRLIAEAKIKKQNVDLLTRSSKILSEQIKKLEPELKKLEEDFNSNLLEIPNIPHESVPDGKDEKDNLEIRKFGEPKNFNFEIKSHWELGKELDILDFERASKVTGARFVFYKNFGARLERALINFMLDTHYQAGYREIFPPFVVNESSMYGTGQLPKFREEAFKLENNNYFLIPTAEVPVTNLYRNETLKEENLPIKHCAYSACFRAEAGAAGKDTRGLIRLHQFNKVELVKFCHPDKSYEELENLTLDAEKILQLLNIPYRVVKLCAGDLGFSSAMTYDIEVWMPSYNRYVEISSCSNFEDYQARRLKIKFKSNLKNKNDKSEYIHTLNGSGLAIGRTLAAILENCQNSAGKINTPDILKKYLDL